MFIQATGVLKDWLAERGMPEATEGIVLSEEQQARLPGLREQAKSFSHYDAEGREAWAIWTALTHVDDRRAQIGHGVVFPGAGTDDLKPTLEIVRASVSAIAKASHGLQSSIKELPEAFSSLDKVSGHLRDHERSLADHSDRLRASLRETDVAASAIKQSGAGLVGIHGELLDQVEKVVAICKGTSQSATAVEKCFSEMVASASKAASGVSDDARRILASLTTATNVIGLSVDSLKMTSAITLDAVESAKSMAKMAREAAFEMQQYSLNFPRGPVTILPTPPPPPPPEPLPWYEAVWIRFAGWGAIIALLAANMVKHGF